MEIHTLEDFRVRRLSREPLFLVRFLPYLDSPLCDGRYGRMERAFTTAEEAREAFCSIRDSGHVEEVSLHRFYATGLLCTVTVDEWAEGPRSETE